MEHNAKEAIAYIEDHTWSATRLGLERTKTLLDLLGNPQNELKFIHIAGSNGKGSAAAMLESILRASGYKTGLYTSPYLESFNEQLKVNGIPIDDDSITRMVDIVRPAADSMEDHPSRFELLTACAFIYFLEQECDIVILEVGMGGEMDSTNVIPPPIVSVIMNIGLDHCEYLGNTIEEIAKTKAGIIKSGSECVCYDSGKENVDIISKRCQYMSVPITIPDFTRYNLDSISIKGMNFSTPYGKFSTTLLGKHQIKNAAVVLETINILRKKGYSISDKAIEEGLLYVNWPARLEVLSYSPFFMIDGAHNPQCVEALSEGLRDLFYAGDKINSRFTFLIGVLEDKDYVKIIETMKDFAIRFICTTPSNPRALSSTKLAKAINDICPSTPVECADDMDEAIALALSYDDPVISFGSLYLVGDIRGRFKAYKKSIQRDIARRLRSIIPEPLKEQKSASIYKSLINNPLVKDANTIMSYMALEVEVDLDTFNRWVIENGKKLVLPVCKEDGRMEAYSVPDLSDEYFINGTFGIREPDIKSAKSIDSKDIDVVITPCVAFDDKKRRLGQGKGYYDRFLSRCPDAKRILVAFNEQRLEEICVESFDLTMDEIICS